MSPYAALVLAALAAAGGFIAAAAPADELSPEIIQLEAKGQLGRAGLARCLVVPAAAGVVWLFNGTVIVPDGRLVNVTNKTLPLPDKDADGNQKMYLEASVHIRQTTTKWHGNFTCLVSVPGRESIQRHVLLDLRIPASLVDSTKTVRMNSEQAVVLSCLFRGFGLQEVKWKKANDMQRVLAVENIHTTIINETHILSSINITDLVRKDNGTYLCGVYDPIVKKRLIGSIDVLVLDRPQVNIDYVKAVGAKRIFLNWTINDGNSPVEAYQLQYRKNGTESWTYYSTPVGGGNTSFVLEGLDPSTSYQLKISAKNSFGVSQVYTHPAWIKTLEEDPHFVPEPTIKGFTVSSVTIGWVPPSEEQAEYIQYYELVAQESTSNNSSSSKKMAIQDYRNLPYMFDKLAPATTYVFKVRACSELTRECGAWSAPVNGSTLDGMSGPPAAVSVLCSRDVMTHTDYLLASWEPPAAPNGKLVRYNVELKGSASYLNEEGVRVNATWGPKIKYAMETSRTARFDNLPANTNYTVEVSGVTRTKRPGAAVAASCTTPPAPPAHAQLQRYRWDKVKEHDGRFMFRLHLPRVTERNGAICCYRVFLVRLARHERAGDLPPPANLQLSTYQQAHSGRHGGAYLAEMITSDNFPQQAEVILGDGSSYNGANEKTLEQCRMCAKSIPQRVVIKPTTHAPPAPTSPRIPITGTPKPEERVESQIANLNILELHTTTDRKEETTTASTEVKKTEKIVELVREITEKSPSNLVDTVIGKDDQMDQGLVEDGRYTLNEEFYMNRRIIHQNKKTRPSEDIADYTDTNFRTSEESNETTEGVPKRILRDVDSGEDVYVRDMLRRFSRQVSTSENFDRIMSEQSSEGEPPENAKDKDRKELDVKILNIDSLEGPELEGRPRVDKSEGVDVFDGHLDVESNYTAFIELIVQSEKEGSALPVYSDYLSVLKPGPDVVPADGEDTVELILKITCGVTGSLLLLTVVACAVHTHRQRKARRHGVEMHPLHATLRHIYHGLKGGRHQLVSSAPPDMPPIAKAELPAAFAEREADSGYGFQREFEMLPDCFAERTTHASDARENQPKNRYPDIKAYDQTRVKLSLVDSVVGSDYINANYVMGYKERKRFVCAQGPTEATVGDFWRMVWEHDLRLVVMLTNLEEHSKVKCSRYWPEELRGRRCFGGVAVQHVGEKRYSDYIVRELKISKQPTTPDGQPIVENNGVAKKNGGPAEGGGEEAPPTSPHANGTAPEERLVRQYHFLVWRDFVAPEYPQAILKFIKRIDEAWQRLGIGDVLVHCSAGVGRTGTLVALHCLLEQLRHEGQVAVFNTVAELRRQRNFLVQSLKQYVFVYRALAEHAHYGDTELTASKLKSSVDRLRNTPEGADKCLMEEEFERMLVPAVSEPAKSTSAGSAEEARARNRSDECLPYDTNRVILTPIPGRDFSTYINASFIEGYDNSECYIITQDPLPGTIADFWRLVSEQGVSTIVMLSELGEGERKCPRYWDDGGVQYDHITVQYQHSDSCPYYTRREFRITNNKNGDVTVARQLQYHGWPTVSGQVPEVTRGLAELADAADPRAAAAAGAAAAAVPSGPTLVHCSLGTERSSMFVALCILICQLRTERRVDVASVARKVRSQRANTLTTFLQYEFLHRAILNYAELHNLLEDS